MALQCTEEADIKVVEEDSNKGDSSKDTKEAVLTNLVEADMEADVDFHFHYIFISLSF